MMSRRSARRPLRLELLESRVVLSAFTDSQVGVLGVLPPAAGDLHPLLVAGNPNGSPPDSPSNRVDPNTTSSAFGGVGSLAVSTRRGLFLCTATPISSRHVLTAGHCVDINNDGRVTSRDGIRSVTFYLNFGGNLTHGIRATVLTTHPDYTGFARPSVNDDVAVLTLASALPAEVPIYGLYTGAMNQPLTMVGYGDSGDGVNGYYVGASFTVKRTGMNSPDAFWGQDDAGRPDANEVFRYDFDGPSGNGTFGGPTLGNDRETTLGGGDSGGPSFVQVGSNYQVAGINTFTQGSAPYFGSLGGGMAVPAYAGWIQSVTGGIAPGGEGTSTGTRGALAVQLSPSLAEMTIEDGAALALALGSNGAAAFRVAAAVAAVHERPEATSLSIAEEVVATGGMLSEEEVTSRHEVPNLSSAEVRGWDDVLFGLEESLRLASERLRRV